MSTSDRLTIPTKYAAPRLVIYGGMVALTASGTTEKGENKNNTGKAMA